MNLQSHLYTDYVMKLDVILSKCLHTKHNQCRRSRIKRKWGMLPFDMSYNKKRRSVIS